MERVINKIHAPEVRLVDKSLLEQEQQRITADLEAAESRKDDMESMIKAYALRACRESYRRVGLWDEPEKENAPRSGNSGGANDKSITGAV